MNDEREERGFGRDRDNTGGERRTNRDNAGSERRRDADDVDRHLSTSMFKTGDDAIPNTLFLQVRVSRSRSLISP